MFSFCPQGEGIPQGTYPPAKETNPPSRPGRGAVPQGTYPPTPHPGQDRGRGTPRYLPPSRSGQGEGYPKVPTPCPGQDRGGVPQGTHPHPDQGYLKVPTPIQVRTEGQGTTQGTYPPVQVRTGGTPRYLPAVQVRVGEGYPKVPTPKVPTPIQVRMGEVVPQGIYPPVQVRMGGGDTPRYLSLPQGTYPLPPRIGQHVEYLPNSPSISSPLCVFINSLLLLNIILNSI